MHQVRRVKISKMSEDGREQILHILKPGHFAEVLFDQGPYPATAEAVENTTCWLLRNAAWKTLASHPQLAIKLLRIMSGACVTQILIRDLLSMMLIVVWQDYPALNAARRPGY